ncbi:MAG: HEPN domain-containing protein [Candidatus Firestonebacteria bacterium]|nr:HEPN domain-containing protein [Candidatus Firestonebacteria bacterium]
MVNSKIIKEWLIKADEDFDFASSVIEDSPYYAQICFHFQQAAEKYLKAFIVANELEFLKIHDLIELLNICLSKESALVKIQDDCIFLSRYYIDTRYPVHWPTNYTKEDAIKSQDAAKNIADIIKKNI